MNAARLIAHFDRISEAPDAIARLRRFILDLAVRGRLVQQDPTEEPASELLKRIQTEKARLLKAGELKKEKALPQIEEDDAPFGAPAGWEWVPIRQVTSDRGQTVPDEDFTYIDVTAIDKEAGRIAGANVVSASDAPSRARKLVRRGDVLYSCVRPYLLNIAVVDSDLNPPPIASTAFAVLDGFGLVVARYLWIVLRSPVMVERVEAKMRGQAYPAINDADFAMLPLPLPPLAEQERIVAKVDELLVLCDRLEAAQAERERRRDRVVAASLHRLNEAAQAPAAREHAAFYLQQLPRLLAKPQDIAAHRGAIFNGAMQGRLTADWRDAHQLTETSHDCLSSIASARRREWIAKGAADATRKYTAPLDYARDNLPTIPNSWTWASADTVCSQITDGEHIQPPYQVEGVPMLTAKHVRDGFVTFEDCELISKADFDRCVTRCKPEQGDLLVVSVGATTGRAAIVEDSRPFALVRSVLLLKPLINAQFFLQWLQSPWCLAWMRQASEASAQPHMYIGDTKRMPVPIPPVPEQKRIVAKVEELMGVCDQLEAQMTTADTGSRRFIEAVLHEALAESV